jgi:peptidyl-prolyl cis-trans isomerase C
MKLNRAIFLAACLSSMLSPLACKKDKAGPAVAHVGGEAITADEFKRRIDEQSPFLRARYGTLERKKELLEALVRNELLAQEAQREGLDKAPSVRDATKRAMIQELIKKQLDDKMSGADIADTELKAFYDSHLDDYVKPERARVYHIFLPAKDAKERAQAKAKALTLLRDIQAREKRGEVNAFQAVAIKESKDPLSAPMGGDLRFLSKDELAKSHGPELATAAFDLKSAGDVVGPLETPAGIEIVKLQVKTVALNRSFDESKETIRGRMARERRSKQYDDFVKRLRDQGNVSIDEAELAKVSVEPPTPTPVAAPQTGPAPAAAKIGGN